MKPKVWKVIPDVSLWGAITEDEARAFTTWRDAFDWAYSHATQHRKEGH